MTMLGSNLVMYEEEFDRINSVLGRLWTDANAKIVFLVDKNGQQIAAIWIAKEHLRALLALRATKTHVTPAPSAVPATTEPILSNCLRLNAPPPHPADTRASPPPKANRAT